MFLIGEKISYPMHGAGVIENIEERTILEKTRQYYILKLSCGDMKVMVPVESSDAIGVRDVVTTGQLDEVVGVLKSQSTDMSNNWNKRNRENMDKLKTGDLCAVAEVVRNLMRSDNTKKLSAGEKKMLSDAKNLLLSEIILVRDIELDDAEKMVQDAVFAEMS